MNKQITAIIITFIILGLVISNWIFSKPKTVEVKDKNQFADPLKKLVLRNDIQGKGSFNAVRIGHAHEGVDYLCAKGETVYSPISGIVKAKNPYSTDLKYKGCIISDENTDTEVTLFYLNPTKIGKMVQQGEALGTCQAINEKYGKTMKNHLHLEIRVGGVLVNPEEIFNL